jgi:hypothetical protein
MRISTSKSTLIVKMVSDALASLYKNVFRIDTDFLGEFNVKPRKKDKDMWTEVTKDLVLREAIEQMGYSCEETEDFFYVMEYLKYVSSSPPAWSSSTLTVCRRMFFSSSNCPTRFAASASFASSLSALASASQRDLQATTRNSTSARSPMIGTDSVDTAKYRVLAHLAAKLCSFEATRSETSETTRQVLYLEPPHPLVLASV